jgi:hypothetical protein
MALKGTLQDITVIDLLQFPNGGRKTGRLSIANGEQRASLHYVDGSIIDAVVGNARGFEAVVALVDWEQGEFAFEVGPPHTDQTVEEDLHRLVMRALKVRDERKLELDRERLLAEERVRQRESSIRERGMDPALCDALDRWREANADVELVVVLDGGGARLAESIAEQDASRDADALIESFDRLGQSYPRGAPVRAFIEDPRGIVASVTTKSGAKLLLATRRQLALGAVLMAATKLAAALESEVVGGQA